MRVLTNDDGREHTADNAADLVNQLNNNSYQPAETDELWMQQTAERVKMLTGNKPRTSNAEFFIQDLIRYDILTDLDKPDDE